MYRICIALVKPIEREQFTDQVGISSSDSSESNTTLAPSIALRIICSQLLTPLSISLAVKVLRRQWAPPSSSLVELNEDSGISPTGRYFRVHFPEGSIISTSNGDKRGLPSTFTWETLQRENYHEVGNRLVHHMFINSTIKLLRWRTTNGSICLQSRDKMEICTVDIGVVLTIYRKVHPFLVSELCPAVQLVGCHQCRELVQEAWTFASSFPAHHQSTGIKFR